jgi:hypothetical protein
MTRQTSLIHPDLVQYNYRSSSERDTERPRYGYRIGPKGDRKSQPGVLNSLPNSIPNGITRDSQDKYQEMMTEISQGQTSLPKDFT